jgi:hypothetical protein
MAILRFPIRIGDGEAIGKRTTESLAALEGVEPRFEWRSGIPAIVVGSCAPDYNSRESDGRKNFHTSPVNHFRHHREQCWGISRSLRRSSVFILLHDRRANFRAIRTPTDIAPRRDGAKTKRCLTKLASSQFRAALTLEVSALLDDRRCDRWPTSRD